MGADTKANMWGGGAPEAGDLRLLEDGSESGGALVSDVVAPNTASEGQDGNGERVRVSMWALTQKRTLRGAAAHLSEVIFVSLRAAASAEAPSSPMPLYAILQARGRMGTVRE